MLLFWSGGRLFTQQFYFLASWFLFFQHIVYLSHNMIDFSILALASNKFHPLIVN